MNIDLDLIGKDPGTLVQGNVDGVEYVFQIITIRRGQALWSFSTDLHRLQTLVSEAYRLGSRRTQQLIKLRARIKTLEARILELEAQRVP